MFFKCSYFLRNLSLNVLINMVLTHKKVCILILSQAAGWALGYVARHNDELAQYVVEAGAVPLLVLCLQEPEVTLKCVAASALSDIAKHTPELAQMVVDAGAISVLVQVRTSNKNRIGFLTNFQYPLMISQRHG